MEDEDNQKYPPLVVSYNDKIRPILEAMGKLRHLKIKQEAIPIPTIVVVGERSSGKSSVLESLTGISFSRGCTRVPLIMRLQHHLDPAPEFRLEFQKKSLKIVDESQIYEAIGKATVEIAGNCYGISNVPMTLVVKKKGVPDLTLVDLPGIAWVPIGDQPKNIYEQITGMIMKYIEPTESVILNVLSASVDFTICKSIVMSGAVDITGQRTIAVVTKCDESPDSLLKKVNTNEVGIELGYICVRNRMNQETYDEALEKEATFFQNHPLLSKMDNCLVGVPALAQRIVEIQSGIIAKSLSNIINNIEKRLNASKLELNQLPKILSSVPEACDALMQSVGSFKDALQKIVLQSQHYSYANNKEMHCSARLADMLDKLSKDLVQSSLMFSENNFLVEEIEVLEEVNGIKLPNFLPHSMFLELLERKVSNVSHIPISFVKESWGYLEIVFDRVLSDCCANYPQLLPAMRKVTHNVMEEVKLKFQDGVEEIIEIEKTTDFTRDPDFIATYYTLIGLHEEFFTMCPLPYSFEYFGSVNTNHLSDVPRNICIEAFDLKMRFTAYWRIALRRLVDNLGLRLSYFTRMAVNKVIEGVSIKKVVENVGGIENMLGDQHMGVCKKRVDLQRSIILLNNSKQVLEQIMKTTF